MFEYVRHHLKWGTKNKWVPQRWQICSNVQNLSSFMSETKANTSKTKMTKFLKNWKAVHFLARVKMEGYGMYFSVLVGKTVTVTSNECAFFGSDVPSHYHRNCFNISGPTGTYLRCWKSIMNSVVFTVEQVLLKKLSVFNQGWATLDTTKTKCWAIGHLTVVFLVAKPLIWSEAEVDHVVIETSV